MLQQTNATELNLTGSRTGVRDLQCAHYSPAANQLRDADARGRYRVV